MKKCFLTLLLLFFSACTLSSGTGQPVTQPVVAHENRWGIYRLDLKTQSTTLIYSSPEALSGLSLNRQGDRFAFSRKVGGDDNANLEIFTMNVDGQDLRRLTNNTTWDLYPVWSPDGSRIAYLSWQEDSLGIYVMDADGSNSTRLLDSSANEADIDWRGGQIVFTRDSSIWIMQADGTGARQITFPPRAGVWGEANLPFGDYDPRISPDGANVVFERLLDDRSPHGNYDFFLVNLLDSTEVRLTNSGYSQGLASWSNSGEQIVTIVAAVGEAGQYHLYWMNADGTGNHDITPAYFPAGFLCQWAVLSGDDSAIYFIGEWWEA